MVPNSGVCTQTYRNKTPLANIVKADLTDTGRLLSLFVQAVEAGLVDGGEARQLDWVGMAERALRVARNPVRMFVSNIKAGRWNFISNDDEQAAQARIKQYRYGERDADDVEDLDLRIVDGDERRSLLAELEIEQR